MPRIAGRDIPENKNIEISLTYIYGIGKTLAHRVLQKTKLAPHKKTKDLTEAEINALRTIIEGELRVEGALRQQVREDIKRLKDVRSYRGSRHEKRLPVRGQHTRTNTRSVRGNVRRTAAGTSAKKSQPAPT